MIIIFFSLITCLLHQNIHCFHLWTGQVTCKCEKVLPLLQYHYLHIITSEKPFSHHFRTSSVSITSFIYCEIKVLHNVKEISAGNLGPPEVIPNWCISRELKDEIKTDLVNNSHSDLQNVGDVHYCRCRCLKGQTQVVNHHLHSTGFDGGDLDTHTHG